MKKILYFSAAWCGPCKMLGPIMESLAGEINYEKIDVDNNQDLSIQYGVRNIPTLILVENGEAVGRLTGLQQKDQILEFYNR
ncbi:thioredoxin domain-containing protein [bacterium]|jgi:thioredoxin 1|nr:thioredoxin domain-containing protein [bacterium]